MRKVFSIAALVLTVGFLLAILTGSPRDAAINAGRLTTAHSGDDLDCSSCHVETSLGELSSVTDLDFLKERAMANSQLCLNCHSNEIGDWITSARFAHGWSESHLEEKTAEAEQKVLASSSTSSSDEKAEFAVWLASKGPLPKNGANGELACATCHQEHHGPEFNLRRLADQQCQVCHQQQFHSFGSGHPTFASTNYPYSRRTRIFFDHESHYGKHFDGGSDESIPGYDPDNPFAGSESCQHCHQPDDKGEFMKLKGYAASCAGCHEEAVKGGDALTMLAIPEIETEAVEGVWPKSGYGLVPAMRLILSAAPARSVMDLKAEDEFGSVWIAEKEHRELSAKVATDLRSVFFTSWQEGSGALVDRLKENGFEKIGNEEDLFSGLSADTLRQFLFPGGQHSISELAFPGLDLKVLNPFLLKKNSRSLGSWPAKSVVPLTPLMQHLLVNRPSNEESLKLLKSRAGEDGSIPLNDLSSATPEELRAVESLAWEIKSLYVDLRKNGAPFLKEFEALHGGILDMEETGDILAKVFISASSDKVFADKVEAEVKAFQSGTYPAPVEEKSAPANAGSPARSKGDDDFGDTPAKEKKADAEEDDFGADDDDFGDTPAKEKKAVAEEDDFGADDDDFGDTPAKEKKADAAEDDFGADEDEFGKGPAEDKKETEKPGQKYRPFEPDPVDWHKTGGWFRENNSVKYRSRGHADPVIRSWIDTTITAANSNYDRVRDDALRMLEHTLKWKEGRLTSASGKCFKCHTVDQDPESKKLSVNWFAAYGTPSASNPSSELTRFPHSEHFNSLDCISCHKPIEKSSYADFFPARDETISKSDPTRFSSNFEPINEKVNCGSCHQETKAGNSCVQCHNYHSYNAFKW